jgi:hypothetical protein
LSSPGLHDVDRRDEGIFVFLRLDELEEIAVKDEFSGYDAIVAAVKYYGDFLFESVEQHCYPLGRRWKVTD